MQASSSIFMPEEPIGAQCLNDENGTNHKSNKKLKPRKIVAFSVTPYSFFFKKKNNNTGKYYFNFAATRTSTMAEPKTVERSIKFRYIAIADLNYSLEHDFTVANKLNCDQL